MLGSRSAIEWIIDRYQVKTDKASGIVNDPNDWCAPGMVITERQRKLWYPDEQQIAEARTGARRYPTP